MAAEIKGLDDLLDLIPDLEHGEIGNWADTGKHAGTAEDPLIMPYVTYSPAVEKKLIEEIYRIDELNSGLGLHSYVNVLEEYGFEWSDESLRSAVVAELDARCILAMILAIVRADRFSEGILLQYLEEGIILAWLNRLNELEDHE